MQIAICYSKPQVKFNELTMTKKQMTKDIYHQRIQRVIDYIYEHLDEKLLSEKLSEVACFSPYHWHRIYHSVTGETYVKTIRRLRLQRAAFQLVNTGLSIEKIARNAGYDNTHSFTRKFTEDFALPPNAYRKKGHLLIEKIINPTQETKKMYTVEIKNLDAITLATMEHQGDYLNISKVFDQLLVTAGHHGLLNENTKTFGMYYDDPAEVAAEDLRSKAGITVEENFIAQGQLGKTIIPAMKYAVLIYKGSYTEIEKAYQWLYGVWLVESGHEPADAPVIEEYLNDPRKVTPSELLTAIHMPLAS
jgi:AraC family transcriptional regulator